MKKRVPTETARGAEWVAALWEKVGSEGGADPRGGVRRNVSLKVIRFSECRCRGEWDVRADALGCFVVWGTGCAGERNARWYRVNTLSKPRRYRLTETKGEKRKKPLVK